MSNFENPLTQLCDSALSSITSIVGDIQLVEASNQEVAQSAESASEVSASGIELAHATNATFDELRSSSEEIGEVLRLIDNVADETHLLALNATIEAARAGEAGAGFAVVAAEVKHLATQTATATLQVNQRISAIQSSATNAIDAMQKIVAVVTQISELQCKISKEIHAQDGITQNMLDRAGEVSTRLEQITQQVSAAGETLAHV